jgi:dTDP-4-dehydrorhamnose reductase
MKKILATGAIGLIGSRFTEMFKDKYEVANIDILSGVDITDKSSVEKFVADNPSDILIHLAAFTDTNKAWEEKGNTDGICYKVNVVGTKNIAEVCKDKGIHLIHISTDFIFDGTKESPYVETDVASPIEWYGETKAIAENVVIESGVSYTIVRLAYPYRADFAGKPDIIKKLRAGLESGKLYPQFSDTVITPTFIDDIARAFDKMIEQKPTGIYHVTGSTSLSPFELAQKVAVAYGYGADVVKEGSLTEYLKTASRPFARKVAMSNAKASSGLGLTFATLDEGLAAIKKQQGL